MPLLAGLHRLGERERDHLLGELFLLCFLVQGQNGKGDGSVGEVVGRGGGRGRER